MNDLPERLAGLLDPSFHQDGTTHPELVETHISWVVLSRTRAYKVKKPRRLGFVDYRTLESRKAGCEAELALNRRFAPSIYLGVVALVDDGQRLVIDRDDGEIVDYAVLMRRFDRGAQLDAMLAADRIDAAALYRLGDRLARAFRDTAPAAPHDPDVQPDVVMAQMRDNFAVLRPRFTIYGTGWVDGVERWFDARAPHLADLLRRRLDDGMVRDAHGDLHAGNLVLLDGELTAFDCIEFDRAYRVVDVISDIGFLFMDLCFRRRDDLAYALMTGYLETSGDYGGIALLRPYAVYRALVRAKIAMLARNRPLAHDYVVHAAHLSTPRGRPVLVLMHGLSGSGKTTVSETLVAGLRALRVRSDLERKRLAGIAPGERSGSPVGGGIYDSDASARTYGRLAAIARDLLCDGFRVIVDAAFLRQADRARFLDIAERIGAAAVIVSCTADEATLRARLEERSAAGRDVSEAGVEVLDNQQHTAEPLTPTEQRRTVTIGVDEATGWPTALVERIESIAGVET